MRTRDADGTRKRILAAATEDFAEHGIAGARVDRIAARAEVAKAQIYAYYGDKLALFRAVFNQNAAVLVEATPFTPDDLPGYAVGLYNGTMDRPDLIRLLTWARLEGVPPNLDDDAWQEKLDQVAAAQTAGVVTPDISPANILAMLAGVALSWSAVAPMVLPPSADDEHRAALRLVIERSFHA
ncbi:TetR/AcrR family transcriptional regulator [Winogradskya humida]|uniref:TetR family transcriptional regulator n=1 Tax=Winogradskya humida TaxID=113566 RepID=A0ABQ3ZMU6_9ACTN|nr:TetR family transcriptional regulator [Actinoplanes humidus]GIE19907.1 TetR family transcriptional regulator [Actinoplanes humidus]